MDTSARYTQELAKLCLYKKNIGLNYIHYILKYIHIYIYLAKSTKQVWYRGTKYHFSKAMMPSLLAKSTLIDIIE